MKLSLFRKMGPSISCIIKPVDAESSKGGLYLGNLSSVFELRKDTQCEAVLSVIQDIDMEELTPHVKSHLFIKLDDIHHEQISIYFDQTYEFIKTNLQTTNVLIHCMAGISRSATIVIAYLIREFKLSTKDALNVVQSKRDIVLPNEGFLNQLRQYEQSLKS